MFERASFIDSLKQSALPEICGPHLTFERSLKLGLFGQLTQESEEAELDRLGQECFEASDREIDAAIQEVERLFANLAASLKLDLREELVARAQEGALCSEQSQLESHAAAAPADPQAECLGLPTLCLTPRLLAQRPAAARVCAGTWHMIE